MLLRGEDLPAFKRWLLPKLETISDADAEVLADYVAALVTANDSEANIQRNCTESLADFLQENTEPFVSEVLKALAQKSFLAPAAPAPIPSVLNAAALEYDPNRRPRLAQTPPLDAPTKPAGRPAGARTQTSRKRKAPGRDVAEAPGSHDFHYDGTQGPARQNKHTVRRDAAFSHTSNTVLEPQNLLSAFAALPNLPNLPPPPPGLPPFDMSNPMAMMAMMAALGAHAPPLGTPEQTAISGQRQKCQDYHERGFCLAGNQCPLEHEDPARPTHKSAHRHKRAVRRRASFSLTGPSYDLLNTTLVIEQIPQANLDEDEVRSFFSHFGPVTKVEIHAHRRLAIVKFQDHASADEAYRSPKAVFDNRFVKVYWLKPDSFSVDDTAMVDRDDEEPLDLAEIEKRQAEAQKAFEERRKKQEAAESRAAEIERLLKEKDDEMRSIRRQLAALAAGKSIDGLEDEHSHTLATLQAEAESLLAQHGLKPHAGIGRGVSASDGYSGYGSAHFPPHGHLSGGFIPRRGGFSGRSRGRPSRVKKIDNRPKRLAIAGIIKGSPKDEALRQFLVNIPECIHIDEHLEQRNTLILTFQERYHAESFLDSSLNIPDMGGPLELSWVPNTATSTSRAVHATDNTIHNTYDSSDTMDDHDMAKEKEQDDVAVGPEADMDVADDVDRWL